MTRSQTFDLLIINLWPPQSNQFILQSMLTFVPKLDIDNVLTRTGRHEVTEEEEEENVKKFPQNRCRGIKTNKLWIWNTSCNMFLIHSNKVKMLKVKWGCAEKFLLCWRRVVVAVVCVAGCSRSSPVSPARSSPWSRWAAVHLHHICSSSPSLTRSLTSDSGRLHSKRARSLSHPVNHRDR